MPPIWACIDCRGIAYGWARCACIYCGSERVVGSHTEHACDGGPTDFRLVLVPAREWAAVKNEAHAPADDPVDVIARRFDMQVVWSCPDPSGHGHLILLHPTHLEKDEATHA